MNSPRRRTTRSVEIVYSHDKISYLLRTALARLTIRTILLCGRDMTDSGAALVALWRDGLVQGGRIVGDSTRLHPEIPSEAVELVRRNVSLHDARDTVRPEQIAALLRQLRHPVAPLAPALFSFPYSKPVAAALPAADASLLLHDRFVRGAYLKLLWHMLRFGVRSGTQHNSDQREILDVLTVVSNEPCEPTAYSHAEWMPFTRANPGHFVTPVDLRPLRQHLLTG